MPKLTRRKKKSKTNDSKKKKKNSKQKQADVEAKKQYEIWKENNPEVVKVSEKFILANCYNPAHVKEYLSNYY